MTLFEQPTPPAPMPEQAARRIRNQANQGFEELVRIANDGTKMFWGNPNFTPNQIYDALGVADAVGVFTAHAALKAAILAAKPDQPLDDSTTYGWSYTVDENTGALTTTAL